MPSYRVISVNEEQHTSIGVAGFITEWKTTNKGKTHQQALNKGTNSLNTVRIVLQFLEHHKMQLLDLHRELGIVIDKDRLFATIRNSIANLKLQDSDTRGPRNGAVAGWRYRRGVSNSCRRRPISTNRPFSPSPSAELPLIPPKQRTLALLLPHPFPAPPPPAAGAAHDPDPDTGTLGPKTSQHGLLMRDYFSHSTK